MHDLSEGKLPDKPPHAPNIQNPGDGQEHLHEPLTIGVASAPKERWKVRRQKKSGPSETKRDHGQDAMLVQGAPVSKKPRRKAWPWVAALGVLLLAAGVVLGTFLPDPRSSKEYLALQSEKTNVESQRGTLQQALEKLQLQYNSLDAGIRQREAAVKSSEASVAAADAKVKTAEAAVKQREEAVRAAEQQKAANTVREGTWTVGVDIEPGTYRTTSEVLSSCYWGIYRTGSNGADIIDNDIVSGGRPSVTLSPGQDFKTSRCGTWTKQ